MATTKSSKKSKTSITKNNTKTTKTKNNTIQSQPFVVIGCDHGGFATKEVIVRDLVHKGYTILDVGTFTEERVDYIEYAAEVARTVVRDKKGNTKGILICGTGTGMCIASNKINGVRAALGYDKYSVTMSREHNNANILCLRGREFDAKLAAKLAIQFLSTPFSNESRHIRRIKMITSLEKTHK